VHFLKHRARKTAQLISLTYLERGSRYDSRLFSFPSSAFSTLYWACEGGFFTALLLNLITRLATLSLSPPPPCLITSKKVLLQSLPRTPSRRRLAK